MDLHSRLVQLAQMQAEGGRRRVHKRKPNHHAMKVKAYMRAHPHVTLPEASRAVAGHKGAPSRRMGKRSGRGVIGGAEDYADNIYDYLQNKQRENRVDVEVADLLGLGGRRKTTRRKTTRRKTTRRGSGGAGTNQKLDKYVLEYGVTEGNFSPSILEAKYMSDLNADEQVAYDTLLQRIADLDIENLDFDELRNQKARRSIIGKVKDARSAVVRNKFKGIPLKTVNDFIKLNNIENNKNVTRTRISKKKI